MFSYFLFGALLVVWIGHLLIAALHFYVHGGDGFDGQLSLLASDWIMFLMGMFLDLPLGSSIELRLVIGVQQNGTLSTTLHDCNPWSGMAHQMPFDSI